MCGPALAPLAGASWRQPGASEVSDMLASGGVVDPDVDGRAVLAFVVFKIG